ncbi:MAG: carbohydrate-binding domain-containing protein, partial [Erysipelotrichaceae bacterium]|nr:carbohydrate-binding domain-containing protein [Erysipelotrichaceae bacterium]
KNDEVQLVLSGVTVNSKDFAGIYVIEADQVQITLSEGSVNTITDSGTYTQIDSNEVDALIYSKADLLINGTGTLNLGSSDNHGIVSKDDLIITGGTYNIDVAGVGMKGKDCLKISDGNFTIVSGKDAMKSDNQTDAYRGYVYITGGTFDITAGGDGIYGYNLVNIEGGSFNIETYSGSDADSYKGIKSDCEIVISGGGFDIETVDDGIHTNGNILITGGEIDITSKDDAIHADGLVQIDDGTIVISAAEGIEGTYVLINGGNVDIKATDDGINAAQKSNEYTPTFELNGGYLTISMGQGDTDGVDSNGYIYINDGTIDITAQFPFDYDKGAEHNGGTIIVNGVETEEITNQFGTGGMFGDMPSGFGPDGNGGFPGVMPGFGDDETEDFPGFVPGSDEDGNGGFPGQMPEGGPPSGGRPERP